MNDLYNIRRQGIGTVLLLFLSCLYASVSLAHHSAAMFDLDTTVVLKGKVKKFQWTNPHVWIHITVSDENKVEKTWKIEALNPSALKRKGWKRTSFQAGDEVSVTVYPAKSGQAKAYFIRAILADGTELGQKLADRKR